MLFSLILYAIVIVLSIWYFGGFDYFFPTFTNSTSRQSPSNTSKKVQFKETLEVNDTITSEKHDFPNFGFSITIPSNYIMSSKSTLVEGADKTIFCIEIFGNQQTHFATFNFERAGPVTLQTLTESFQDRVTQQLQSNGKKDTVEISYHTFAGLAWGRVFSSASATMYIHKYEDLFIISICPNESFAKEIFSSIAIIGTKSIGNLKLISDKGFTLDLSPIFACSHFATVCGDELPKHQVVAFNSGVMSFAIEKDSKISICKPLQVKIKNETRVLYVHESSNYAACEIGGRLKGYFMCLHSKNQDPKDFMCKMIESLEFNQASTITYFAYKNQKFEINIPSRSFVFEPIPELNEPLVAITNYLQDGIVGTRVFPLEMKNDIFKMKRQILDDFSKSSNTDVQISKILSTDDVKFNGYQGFQLKTGSRPTEKTKEQGTGANQEIPSCSTFLQKSDNTYHINSEFISTSTIMSDEYEKTFEWIHSSFK